MCLFDTVVAIIHYVGDIVLVSRLGSCLQRLLDKLYFCTLSSLDVNLSKTKIMIFDHDKRKSNLDVFIPRQVPNRDTYEYKYLRVDSTHMATLNHQVKKEKELQV